ncbi:MAG: glycosyltransferase family 39 protein [Verrucomicrobia bacterium]|nr:glycosyltransferase family 39 protein [Verrucomicrobiota bacterium]
MPRLTLSANDRRLLWIALAVLLVLRLAALFTTPFTDTTEARYAEIARKMVETNNWVTPQYDYGIPFWAKPPLSFWTSAIGIKIFGSNEFGARISVLATAFAVLALLFHWIKRWRGRDQAILSTLILSSTIIFYVAAAAVMTDLSMMAGTTLAMVAFWNAMRSPERRRLWGHLFFVGLGIGLLAKGPVAVVMVGIPIGAWVLLRNQWRNTWQYIPWITGSLLGLCIAAPWYLLAELRTPGFLQYFLYGEHIQRFLVSGWEGDLYGNAHSEPLGMIWIYWLIAAAPWSLLALAAFFRPRLAARTIFRSEDDLPFYLLLWILAPLVFFSPARNIIAIYVITGIPAAALLIPELRGLLRRSDHLPSRSLRPILGLATGLSMLIFAYSMIVFASFPDHAPKHSQKPIVLDSLGQHPEANLHYWRSRQYSAEFYSQGRAQPIETIAELELLRTNNQLDYLAVRPKDFKTLPDWVSTSFTPVFTHQGTILLREISQSETPLTLSKK